MLPVKQTNKQKNEQAYITIKWIQGTNAILFLTHESTVPWSSFYFLHKNDSAWHRIQKGHNKNTGKVDLFK